LSCCLVQASRQGPSVVRAKALLVAVGIIHRCLALPLRRK
jgi:hypothetical protein